jgi:hypothetical protein
MEDVESQQLHFWREDGRWWCAVPRPDPLASIRDEGADWWKRFGTIGAGDTPEEAKADWLVWQSAAAIFADIY